MRTQQRSFVVEIKSARRRSKTQPKSIWGNTDFAALVRDTEAAFPFMQNADSETSVSGGSLPIAMEKQIKVAELSKVVEEELRETPLVEFDQVVRHQREVVSPDSQVLKVVASETKRQAAKVFKRRRARRESSAGEVSAVLTVMGGMDLVETDFDDLALLDTENHRLKQLLAKYLAQQNAQLKAMLKRFETA
jgi:hypothetical protein